MSIEFRCDSCSKKYRLDDALAGKRVRCKNCGREMRVPGAVASAASAPPASGASPKRAAPPPPGRTARPVAAPARPAQGKRILVDDEVDVGEYDLKEPPKPAVVPLAPGEGTCPSCGARLAPNAVLCVGCGLNFRTGERLGTQRTLAPVVRHDRASSSESPGGSPASKWIGLGIGGFLALLALGGLALAAVSPGAGAAVASVLFIVGGILALVSGIMFLVAAFKESAACGLMYLFVPFYSLYFILTRANELKKPLLMLLGAIVCYGCAFGAMALSGNLSP